MKFLKIFEPEKYQNIFLIRKTSDDEFCANYRDKNRAMYYRKKDSNAEWTEIPFCMCKSKDSMIRFFEVVKPSAFNTPILDIKQYGDFANNFEIYSYEVINNQNYEFRIGYTTVSNYHVK